MYKQLFDIVENKTNDKVILRTTDGACIPFDPANTDYQEYLRWLELGNQPEPADNPPTE